MTRREANRRVSTDGMTIWTRDVAPFGVPLRLHTVRVDGPLDIGASGAALFEVATGAVGRGEAVLHEKVYGAPGAFERVAEARSRVRERAGLDPHAPWAYVCNAPCAGGPVAGLQVWSVCAVPGTALAVRSVADGGQPVGCLVEAQDTRWLMLSGITGDAALGRGPAAECDAMFERARRILEEHGFRFADVARTWLHVTRLLDWYADLNRVRNAFFARVGIRRPGAPFRPPASTGIQGGHPSGAEIQMDVLAVQETGRGPHRRAALVPMRTTRQNEAPEYGSAFSRGMVVGDARGRLLLVSGTASIGTRGESRYEGDAQAQVFETYLNSAAVLHGAGARLSDAAQALLYFKDRPTWETWRQLRQLELLPDLPAIEVFADVCRPELLVEMEVTAVQHGGATP